MYLRKAVQSILLRLCFVFALISQMLLTSQDVSSRDFPLYMLEITMMDCDLLYVKWGRPGAAVFSQRLNGIQYGILWKFGMVYLSKRKEHPPTHTHYGQSTFAVRLEQASKGGDSSLGVSSLMLDNNVLVWLQIFNTFLDSTAQKCLLE